MPMTRFAAPLLGLVLAACDEGPVSVRHDGGGPPPSDAALVPAFDAVFGPYDAGATLPTGVCGDGILNPREECDDGNAVSRDGCSERCLLEPGHACDEVGAPCRTTTCGDGITEGTEQCDDANSDLGDGCDVYCRAEPRCADGVCTSHCGDGIRMEGEACDDGNRRSGDGCSATCELEAGFVCTDSRYDTEFVDEVVSIPVVHRDFLGGDLRADQIPAGASTHPDFESDTQGFQRNLVESTLGPDGKPVLSSRSHTTIHSADTFHSWYRDTGNVNRTVLDRMMLTREGDAYVFDSRAFFPLNERGWRSPETSVLEPLRDAAQNDEHGNRVSAGQQSFHFTSELRYWFQYRADAPPTLTFRGDDDVWVFLNGKLAVDLGGTHVAMEASFPEAGANWADVERDFGLRDGGVYEVALFHAERHTRASSFRLTLVGFDVVHSVCAPVCGDGVLQPEFEQCEPTLAPPGSCDESCRFTLL